MSSACFMPILIVEDEKKMAAALPDGAGRSGASPVRWSVEAPAITGL
jgi:hypothetical protein